MFPLNWFQHLDFWLLLFDFGFRWFVVWVSRIGEATGPSPFQFRFHTIETVLFQTKGCTIFQEPGRCWEGGRAGDPVAPCKGHARERRGGADRRGSGLGKDRDLAGPGRRHERPSRQPRPINSFYLLQGLLPLRKVGFEAADGLFTFVAPCRPQAGSGARPRRPPSQPGAIGLGGAAEGRATGGGRGSGDWGVSRATRTRAVGVAGGGPALEAVARSRGKDGGGGSPEPG